MSLRQRLKGWLGFTGASTVSQPAGLISVLLDGAAELGDRDDAAMDLGAFDDPDVEEALLAVARDSRTDPDLADTCGESLGQIWSRRPTLDPSLLLSLQPAARRTLVAVLKARRPEWRSLLGVH